MVSFALGRARYSLMILLTASIAFLPLVANHVYATPAQLPTLGLANSSLAQFHPNVNAHPIVVASGQPDIEITITQTPDRFFAGLPGTYNLVIRNVGTATTNSGDVLSVTYALPIGASYGT